MNKIIMSVLSGLTIALLLVLIARPATGDISEMIVLNYKAILMIGTIMSFPIYRLN